MGDILIPPNWSGTNRSLGGHPIMVSSVSHSPTENSQQGFMMSSGSSAGTLTFRVSPLPKLQFESLGQHSVRFLSSLSRNKNFQYFAPADHF